MQGKETSLLPLSYVSSQDHRRFEVGMINRLSTGLEHGVGLLTGCLLSTSPPPTPLTPCENRVPVACAMHSGDHLCSTATLTRVI